MSSTDLCAPQAQSPFATAIHLYLLLSTYFAISFKITKRSFSLVALLVAICYVPQLIKIAINNHTENLSEYGYYFTWTCFRDGNLQGFGAFSAFVIYLQAFIHWAAAIVLLACYVSFRTQRLPSNEASPTLASSPSNPAILAIVLTHAAIIIPAAIYILKLWLQMLEPEDTDLVVLFCFSSLYGIFLRITGILASLAAFIPQVQLMLARSRENSLEQGSLSLLSLGLQVIALTALAVSQGWRVGPLPNDLQDSIWSVEWWYHFLLIGGLAAGWIALALSQLVVLCVALGLGLADGEGLDWGVL
ncbi:hypothetical protein BDV12DRAFT_185627 [Aspergillus spectabilis]